ncbi:MAG: hypothetical protein ACKVG1_03690 [Rhodospirillales bacterium]
MRSTFEIIWYPLFLLVIAYLYVSPGLTPYTAPTIPAILPLGIAFVGMVLTWRFQVPAIDTHWWGLFAFMPCWASWKVNQKAQMPSGKFYTPELPFYYHSI